MTTSIIVPLQPDAPDLAHFADDLAALGPCTSRELAIQYLDQNLGDEWTGTFDQAVTAYEPTCRYYT
jgi:hypothetical protein